MKKIRFITSLTLVIAMILSIGFDNIKMVSATNIQATDEFSVAEQKSVEKYGRKFMEKQDDAFENYKKLMDAFNEENLELCMTTDFSYKTNNLNNTDGTVVSDDMVYPDYYAGSYTDEDGNFVVYKTKEETTSAKMEKITYENVMDEIEEVLDNDNFILKEAEFSYNELNDIMDKLNAYKLSKDNNIANNFNLYWLSDEDNCIYVELDDLNNETVEKFKEEVCDSNAIKFKESTGEFVKQTNIKAGRRLTCNGIGGSVGYRVKRNGNVGFITAGHMGSTGDTIKIGGTAVGTIKARQESGSVDAAFVQVTNDDYTPVNTINGTSNKLSTTISEPGVGTVINKSGASTGITSGKVLSKNVTITLDGIIQTNLTSASYESAGGDSGGTIYSYISSTNTRLTLGIHCAEKNGIRYYIKANEINQALGTSRY